MTWLVSPDATLAGLFLASFLAATLLPGGSELVLVAVLLAHPEQVLLAPVLATVGNTLGGMSTYALARLIPAKLGAGEAAPEQRHLAALHRWGPLALLLAWAPVIGDALCAAAGWKRLPWLPCMFWMALGKAARYALITMGYMVV